MNYKGLLQEYCQKKGLPLPKYNTTPLTNGKFASSVVVNNHFYDMDEKMDTYDTKKEAEQVVAEYALSQIEKKNESEKHSFTIPLTEDFQPTTALFIDIENKQTILKDLEERINMNCFSFSNHSQDSVYFYVFISKYHHLYKKIKDTKYCTVFDIDSPNKDAADVYMTYMCASLGENFKNIGIVTGDHFGHTLVHILKDEGKNSRLLRDIEDIIDFFKEVQ